MNSNLDEKPSFALIHQPENINFHVKNSFELPLLGFRKSTAILGLLDIEDPISKVQKTYGNRRKVKNATLCNYEEKIRKSMERRTQKELISIETLLDSTNGCYTGNSASKDDLNEIKDEIDNYLLNEREEVEMHEIEEELKYKTLKGYKEKIRLRLEKGENVLEAKSVNTKIGINRSLQIDDSIETENSIRIDESMGVDIPEKNFTCEKKNEFVKDNKEVNPIIKEEDNRMDTSQCSEDAISNCDEYEHMLKQEHDHSFEICNEVIVDSGPDFENNSKNLGNNSLEDFSLENLPGYKESDESYSSMTEPIELKNGECKKELEGTKLIKIMVGNKELKTVKVSKDMANSFRTMILSNNSQSEDSNLKNRKSTDNRENVSGEQPEKNLTEIIENIQSKKTEENSNERAGQISTEKIEKSPNGKLEQTVQKKPLIIYKNKNKNFKTNETDASLVPAKILQTTANTKQLNFLQKKIVVTQNTSTQSGTSLQNGTLLANRTDLQNGTLLENGTVLQNGTIIQNGTILQNGKLLQNGTAPKKILIQNVNLLQSVTQNSKGANPTQKGILVKLVRPSQKGNTSQTFNTLQTVSTLQSAKTPNKINLQSGRDPKGMQAPKNASIILNGKFNKVIQVPKVGGIFNNVVVVPENSKDNSSTIKILPKVSLGAGTNPNATLPPLVPFDMKLVGSDKKNSTVPGQSIVIQNQSFPLITSQNIPLTNQNSPVVTNQNSLAIINQNSPIVTNQTSPVNPTQTIQAMTTQTVPANLSQSSLVSSHLQPGIPIVGGSSQPNKGFDPSKSGVFVIVDGNKKLIPLKVLNGTKRKF